MENNIDRDLMLNFLCETVRYVNSIVKMSAGNFAIAVNSKKFTTSTNRMIKKINDLQKALNVELIDLKGSEYSPELPVDPLNLEDFDEDAELVIVETLEPIIKEKDSSHILRFGKVLLAAK